MIVLSKDTLAAAGDSFAVGGSGFNPGEPVVVSLIVDPDTSIVPEGGDQIQANASGAFSVAFDEVGGSGASGYLTFLAEGEDGSLASALVRIVSSPVATTAVDTSLAADVVLVGESARVLGAGFVPGEAVTLSAVGVAGGSDRILVGANANDSGAFMVDAPNPLEVGVYTLRAVGSKGSSATTALLVVESKEDK